MAIIGSLLWGKEGSYWALGIEAHFEEEGAGGYSLASGGPIGRLANFFQGNSVFRIATLGYLHVYIHEMGHALANRLLGGEGIVQVSVHTDTGIGITRNARLNSPWKNTIVLLAGPLINIIFSMGLILGSLALKANITIPVSIFFTIGAAFWITGELIYALVSASQNDNGDFGSIRQNGPLHLLVATAVVVGVVSLGVFGAMAL